MRQIDEQAGLDDSSTGGELKVRRAGVGDFGEFTVENEVAVVGDEEFAGRAAADGWGAAEVAQKTFAGFVTEGGDLEGEGGFRAEFCDQFAGVGDDDEH